MDKVEIKAEAAKVRLWQKGRRGELMRCCLQDTVEEAAAKALKD